MAIRNCYFPVVRGYLEIRKSYWPFFNIFFVVYALCFGWKPLVVFYAPKVLNAILHDNLMPWMLYLIVFLVEFYWALIGGLELWNFLLKITCTLKKIYFAFFFPLQKLRINGHVMTLLLLLSPASFWQSQLWLIVLRKFPVFRNLSWLTVILMVKIINDFQALILFLTRDLPGPPLFGLYWNLSLQLLIMSMHAETMLLDV